MISFNLKSLFTNVPIDHTIEIILSKVYQEKKVKTSIPKIVLRQNLYLTSKTTELQWVLH